MKYGESTFDILYLVFAIVTGVVLLRRRKDRAGRLMGLAALILGAGDAFHLVPRVLNYFVEADFTAWLGVGKLVTSITMTVFYVLMFHIWQELYGKGEDRRLAGAVYLFAAVRVVLCLMPQNAWLTNAGSVRWGILRNIPFVALGALVVCLYWRTRAERASFRLVWLWITLSFLFYIPVAVGASLVPMLGMLMLPKTVCYVLILCAFLRDRADG